MILTRQKLKSIDIEKIISEKISDRKLNELLLIVPTNRKVRKQKQEIISRSPHQSAGELFIDTVGTLSSNIFFHLNPQGKILSESVSTALTRQCFDEVDLKYFTPYKKEIPYGTIERVKNVIGEYKKHGITPDLLIKEAENLSGTEKLKALDIASIYEQNIKKYNDISAFDTGDVYRYLNELDNSIFRKSFFEYYRNVNNIIIDGFDEFTTPEINIINSLSLCVKDKLYLRFDYYKKNPLLFSHLDNCYSKFLDKGFNIVINSNEQAVNENQVILKEKLFNNVNNEKINIEKPLTVITAVSREEETELIAKEIKDLIIKNGVEPHKICVVFNLIGNYSSTIRDVFDTNGIPYNLTDRFLLKESYPVISIINFLEILENDFYYKNIFRALSSGLLEKYNIDLSFLMKAAVELKIVAGYENWKEYLQNARHKYENSDNLYNKFCNKYRKALEEIELIYSLLDPFNKKMTLKEFVSSLINFIHETELPLKFVSKNAENEEINIKALTTFIDTLRELFLLLEREHGTNKKFPLSYFLNHIRTMISAVRYNVKEKPNYGVQITNLNEIRGLDFDYLFIGGLCDGDLPTRYSPEIFFSGSYLKNEIIHQTEERYHFYQSICAFNKALYLTHPLKDNKREFAASGFLTEFCNLFTTDKKTFSDYQNTIFSVNELLKNIGLYGKDNFSIPEEFNLPVDFFADALETDSLRMNRTTDDSVYPPSILNEITGRAKEILKQLSEKQYSISQLETYAKCPYKYFAERILEIDTALSGLEEPTEEIEAFEMGSILHDILYEFYLSIRKKNIVMAQCSDDVFEQAKDEIYKIAERLIKSANFNSPLTFYEREKIVGINGKKENSILTKFLEYERNESSKIVPTYFETSFGKLKQEEGNESFEQLDEIEVDNIKVRGKIDRIDIDFEKKLFRIVDYKLSGKKPSFDDIIDGISLQVTLYIYAAKKILQLRLNEEFNPAGGDIYSLKYSDKEFGKNIVNLTGTRSNQNIDEEIIPGLITETVEKSLAYIKKYVEGIANGKFNLTLLEDRENKVCKYCNFKSICRIQEAAN